MNLQRRKKGQRRLLEAAPWTVPGNITRVPRAVERATAGDRAATLARLAGAR